MIDHKLERRRFLQMCGAAAIGGTMLLPPVDLFAHDTNKKKNTRFKLSKPKWIIYENGSYDLISKEIILKNCRPALNGQGVMPKNVFLGDSPKGKRIVYELPGGFLMLDLKTNKDSISIGAELSGFSKAPRSFFPISQAEVIGVERFYKQGLGTGGQSGVYDIIRSQNQNWDNVSGETSWSYESYLSFAFLGKEETIAVGNIDHNDFLQRATIYNRPHRNGLFDKEIGDEQVFFESAMLLEEVEIENEYIKLPELHFYTGNKPFETLQELTWKSSEVTKARQGSVTSFHWGTGSDTEKACTLENVKNQINFLNEIEPKLPLHTVMVNEGYCVIGDWLETTEKWPGELDRVAREIFKDGYRAGIWLAPFAAHEESKIFEQHPQWLVKDYDNNPIPELINDGGTYYALDGSHPGFQKYLRKVFKALRKAGFIFYETAWMNWGFKDSAKIKRANPGKSSVQIFRDILQLIREEIGPGSLWMADNIPYGPSIGYIDIVKTGSPSTGVWDNKGVKNLIQESYFSHYFNNIYWQNSPGEFCLEIKNTQYTKDEVISLALWNGILGGAVGNTDDMTKWDQGTLNFFRFLEPSKRQKNAYLPFWPDPDEIKVAVRLYKSQRAWGVLFFNDKNKQITKTFKIYDLVDKEEAFIFSWKPQLPIPFGEQTEITVNLEPHQSKLFYLAEKNEAPPKKLTLGGKISDGL